MAEIVDRYLLSRLTGNQLHPVHDMVEHIVSSCGRANVCQLSESSGLSARQIERKFLEQIGITAKRYARLARFRNAARLKLHDRALSWTDVSQAAGFYDHNHLVKDFRELVGATPSVYLRSISPAPATELWCTPADEPNRKRSRAQLAREWPPRSAAVNEPTCAVQRKVLATRKPR